MGIHKRRTLFSGYGPFTSELGNKGDIWLVSALGAFLIFVMVLTEGILNWHGITSNLFNFIFTVSVLVATVVGVVVPLRLRSRYRPKYGLVGAGVVSLVLVYHVGFSQVTLSVNTSLQLLPVIAIYVAWFWGLRTSLIFFSVITVGLIAVSFYSPVIGKFAGIPTAVFVFTILLSWFAYLLGALLRRQLHLKATRDPLTDVLNFRGLVEKLTVDIARANRFHEPLSLVIIDFDLLKTINDQHGHKYGDYVLSKTVAKWRSTVREYDTVARLGGDEFAIILPRTAAADAKKVFERLEKSTEFSWSYGIAQLQPSDTVTSLMSKADKQLYEAKKYRRKTSATKSVEEGPVSIEKLERLKVPAGNFWVKTQNEFPLATSLLLFVVGVSLILAIFFSRVDSDNQFMFYLLIFSAAFMLIFASISFKLAKKFPSATTLLTSLAVVAVYWLLIVGTTNIFDTMSILFSFSIVSLYLGVFSGTRNARILMIVALVVAGFISWWSVPANDGTDDRAFLIASIVYTFLVQFFLFEVGSHLYSQSRNLVDYDALTGVFNRVGLFSSADAELRRAQRGKYQISVAVIDCDNFKAINDTLGHQRGDELLQETAKHLQNSLETFDLVARTGGDEFVLVLPHLTFEEATRMLTRVSREAPIPFSFGVAEATPGDTLDKTITRADLELLSRRQASSSS